MSEEPLEKDEAERDLDELYKDGRKPTLQELLELSKKHNLKLVDVKFPTEEEQKPGEKP